MRIYQRTENGTVTYVSVQDGMAGADERPDAWTVASHKTLLAGRKMLLHRFTRADKDGRALCNRSYRPWRYGNGFVFRTKAQYQASEYADLYTICPRCEAK